MIVKEGRKFLQFFDAEDYDNLVPKSDQEKAMPCPPFQKNYPNNIELIDLILPNQFTIGNRSFIDVLNSRKSLRKFKEEPLSLEELSFLLWSTQGVKNAVKFGVFRTVPSAGARSPFETYLYINWVENLKPGLYRYLSLEHKLLYIKTIDDAMNTFTKLSYDQKFVGNCAVLFMWVAIPYRTEWRYTILAHKFIAIDLGLVTENLYLACEAANLGTVAVGYYEQKKFDNLLNLDGINEFVSLIAPVGKKFSRMSVQAFFKHPESPVSQEDLKKLQGTYSREDIPENLSINIENDGFILRSKSFDENLKPHNKVEFVGGELIRAIRFNFDESGILLNAELLMGSISPIEILEFSKIK